MLRIPYNIKECMQLEQESYKDRKFWAEKPMLELECSEVISACPDDDNHLCLNDITDIINNEEKKLSD